MLTTHARAQGVKAAESSLVRSQQAVDAGECCALCDKDDDWCAAPPPHTNSIAPKGERWCDPGAGPAQATPAPGKP